MAGQTVAAVQNFGLCAKCRRVAPAHHEERDGKVFLVKECPDCGTTEAVASTDAARYREKRRMMGYHGEAMRSCNLRCWECKAHKTPTLVFIDVTNRCNMNCPICLANIPAMGFRFDPPMEYFEKIFAAISKFDPKPKIQLFGGEPTVRRDLVEMIRLARDKYGLSARVVTNGLRLADEAYCKELAATGAQLMFSFDGRHPDIYARTRKHPRALEKKLQALDNIGKYRKSKVTIMTALGEGVNDRHVRDLVDFCHERRSYIAALDLIPLDVSWGPEQVDAQSATIEDVERIMAREIPGMEFFPAGMLYKIPTLRETFPVGRLTFGGAHPNCETVSMMVSDGKRYRPVSDYLKGSLQSLAADALDLDRRMGRRLGKHWLARRFGRRGRQMVYGWNLWRLARRHANFEEIFGGNVPTKLARIVWGLVTGRKGKDVLRANTKCHRILRVIVLPFESEECIESARLVDCPAAFAYEHPKARDVRLMPVCAWPAYKNDILRELSGIYGIDGKSGSLNEGDERGAERESAAQ